MGNSITTAGLTKDLAARHRVVLLGGLAVISHGHARPTYDADIWLDPKLSPDAWAEEAWILTAHHPTRQPPCANSDCASSMNSLMKATPSLPKS